MKLRPYQQQAETDIYNEWNIANSNIAAVLPTGAGKTILLANIVHRHNGPVCVIAHRQELVSQISIALAREGVRHRIIGPKNVVKLCVNLHMVEVGNSYYDPSASCAVAGVDTLVRRGDDLNGWLQSVTLWVQDECFPAGTLVDGHPIETINVGDYVTAFNEKTGGFEKRRVERLFKNPTPTELVSIQAGHHVLNCTKGHPIWTDRGWVNAGNITESDSVYVLQNFDIQNRGVAAVSVAENREDILFENMRQCTPGTESTTEEKTTPADCELYDVWESGEYVSASKSAIPEDGARLLQPGMFEGIQSETIIRNNGGNEPEICVGTNDEKQPNASSRHSRENVGDVEADRSFAEDSRGQRSTGDRSGKDVIGDIHNSRFQSPDDSTDGCISRGERNAESLQNRLRERVVKNSNRSRRDQSLQFRAPGPGRQEGRVFDWQRVGSVSILKRADIERSGKNQFDGFVYNIEVEGLHTYVAEGVVVHNCHHVLKENKWGTAAAMFPNAKGLGVTATPTRADGKGLGRHADGLFDVMVQGPGMRELIDMGYLTDYRIFAPPSDLIIDDQKAGASGDWSRAQLKTAAKKSHIIGDVVGHYLRIAPGKLGVTFATDVETATDIAAQFNAAGVPAEVVSAKTPDADRIAILARFKRRELLQLVNVDLFGEGFDLPAIEVVSMARPTQSFALFVQQFGRALRLMIDGALYPIWDTITDEERRAHIAASSKPAAIIIDHVGNVERHGLPDAYREWSLDRRERRSSSAPSDVIPVRTCLNPDPICQFVYERVYKACPECGYVTPPGGRSLPEQVDGDLIELSDEALAILRGAIAAVDMTEAEKLAEVQGKYMPIIGQRAELKRHRERQEAQEALRASMSWWGGYHRAAGQDDSEIYRRFFFAFGLDFMTAQTLKAADALALAERVNFKLGELANV